MVDVSEKEPTIREAEARGVVLMQPATLRLVRDNAAAKGDVLGVARTAGIMAVKRTADLIPLCHPLSLTSVDIDFELQEVGSRIEIVGRVKTEGKTGVEIEALTGVSVAALTIYDMCKAVDRGMTISEVRVTVKSGGRSGNYREEPTPDSRPIRKAED